MTDGSYSERRYERILIQKEVTINGIVKAHILDMSEGGAYVHTQAELIQGATLDLTFDVFGTPLTVKALVQHVQPGIGAGLRFIDLTLSAAQMIKKFLQSAPMVPEKPIKEEKSAVKKLLLVDDSSQSRAIYRNKLASAGYNVVEASNGVQALKYMHETTFDLVILDLWMEGIDGFKVMQMMSLNQDLKDIPVIMLSARNVPDEIRKALDLGAREFLPKMTTTPMKLLENVREVLSLKRDGG